MFDSVVGCRILAKRILKSQRKSFEINLNLTTSLHLLHLIDGKPFELFPLQFRIESKSKYLCDQQIIRIHYHIDCGGPGIYTEILLQRNHYNNFRSRSKHLNVMTDLPKMISKDTDLRHFRNIINICTIPFTTTTTMTTNPIFVKVPKTTKKEQTKKNKRKCLCE